MGWLRKSTDVAGRSDAVASWGERAAKVLLWIFGPSAVSAVVLGGLGWLWSNPLYGALIGLAAFALTQLGLTLLAIRRSAVRRGPFAELQPGGVVAADRSPSDPEDVEELHQLRAKLREAEQKNASDDALIQGLQHQLSEWDGDRQRFKDFLTEAWREGTNLGGSNPSKEQAREWESHVRYLLDKAIGKEIADKVLRHDPHFQSGDFDATDAQKFLEMRVQRVDQLSKNVARNSAIPFRSGFDPYEWEDWKSPPSTSPGDPAQLKHENKQLQQQHEKAATEAGLPPNVATERRIANCDFHIFDLLRLAGRGSVIKDKDFMNCTIRGPGVIATFVPPWPPEKERENTPISSSFDKHTLYVEGDPDSVLYDVTSDSAFGVIHLVGCTYCRVTFKDIGIAGSPKHLKWWRENVKFSGPRTIGILRSEARIETTPQPGELEARCSHLADELDEEDRIYKSGIESVQLWRQELAEQGLPESEIDEKVARAEDENTIGALNRYNKHLKDRLLGLYDVLGSQGWFGGVDRSRFENPGDPYYMRNLAKRLREVCSKLPDS